MKWTTRTGSAISRLLARSIRSLLASPSPGRGRVGSESRQRGDGREAASVAFPIRIERVEMTGRTDARVFDVSGVEAGVDQQRRVRAPEVEHEVAGPHRWGHPRSPPLRIRRREGVD